MLSMLGSHMFSLFSLAFSISWPPFEADMACGKAFAQLVMPVRPLIEHEELPRIGILRYFEEIYHTDGRNNQH